MVEPLRDREPEVRRERRASIGRTATAGMAVVLAAGCLAPRLQAQADSPGSCPDAAASVHPEAPPETGQFSFLVGRWDVEVTKPDENGSWDGPPRKAYWEGRYILDGFAIADYWYDHPPAADPDTHRGVNVRMFNRASGRWDITWQHTEDPLLVLSGQASGDTMVITGESPDGSLIRIVFSNIRHESWDWQMESSTDQGQSWIPTMRIEAARRVC